MTGQAIAPNATKAEFERKELAKFKPVHMQMAMLYVNGKSITEIGMVFDYHEASVRRIIKSDLVQIEIGRLQGKLDNIMLEADFRMKSLVHRSLDVLEDVLGDPNMDKPAKGDLNQQMRVAEKVLDNVMGMRRGEGSVHLMQVQNIQQIMIDASSKSDKDLVKDTLARIRAAKEVGKG